MSRVYFAKFDPNFYAKGARRLETVATKDGRLQRVWKGTEDLARAALANLDGHSKRSNAVILGGTLIGASASVMAARNTMANAPPRPKTLVVVRTTS